MFWACLWKNCEAASCFGKTNSMQVCLLKGILDFTDTWSFSLLFCLGNLLVHTLMMDSEEPCAADEMIQGNALILSSDVTLTFFDDTKFSLLC